MKKRWVWEIFGAIMAFVLGGCTVLPISPKVLESVKIHGHRGSRGTHPENTLPAFEEALASGAEVLELDLQLTRDDVPVVTHDPDITSKLCRYHDGRPVAVPVPIRSLLWSELAQFDCGNTAQSRFPRQKQVPGTRIPALDEFLTWWKTNAHGLELNIETKMSAEDPKWLPDPEVFARVVVDKFKAHGAVAKTILQSFDFRTLRAAKKLAPTLRLSCLFEDQSNFCELTAAEGAQIASPYQGLVTPEEVQRCHERGIEVVPWTANSESEWQHLLACGVDAIISDYPRDLRAYLTRLRKQSP